MLLIEDDKRDTAASPKLIIRQDQQLPTLFKSVANKYLLSFIIRVGIKHLILIQ